MAGTLAEAKFWVLLKRSTPALRQGAADLWANAASADPRRFMVLSFQRYGIFTFAQFWNLMGAVGFMVSSFHRFSETMVSSFHRCGIF